MYNTPLGYFITFRAYGTWLHGDARGSVDREHNQFGTPMLPASGQRVRWEAAELEGAPMHFDAACRDVIGRTIREVCAHKGWALHEANVRTNHVHVVVSAARSPEFVMNSLKSWATRRLVEAGLVGRGTCVWSRHGSTVYLFREEKFLEKCAYVRECQ
jgi:REP element-mobilizing transposase RayT